MLSKSTAERDLIALTLRHRSITAYYAGTNDEIYSISVSYTTGGHSFITGRHNERGYCLAIIPASLHDGVIRKEAWAGAYKVIESAKRFSQKRFDSLVTEHILNAETSEEVEKLFDFVLVKMV